MVRAVANRPVENLVTNVASPDWQQEPDNTQWSPALPGEEPLIGPDGNPIEPEPPPPEEPQRDDADRPRQQPAEDELDRQWLDRALDRRPAPPERDPPPPPRPSIDKPEG
jgi:hypothetical protein